MMRQPLTVTMIRGKKLQTRMNRCCRLMTKVGMLRRADSITQTPLTSQADLMLSRKIEADRCMVCQNGAIPLPTFPHQ
ncbi:Hypothetical predicted protein [Scomber scombrus]|uniref:Uncharacterized protein n=1 Tax=Scomber scombrus TaxID=13677 RepID=A0AAV1NWY6_SCOSC